LKGNGNLDLVVVNRCQELASCESGLITSLTGFGNGTFKADHKISSGGQYAYSVTTADFDGDGNIDAVVSNGDVTCVLLGNGNGSFQTAIPYYPGGIFVAAGDFNGDRKPDVAIADGALSTVTPLLNIVGGYRQVTTTTLTSAPDPSSVYQSVLFTATVSSPAGGTPTGTVTFESGRTELGQGNLNNGQATLNYAFTTRGQYSVTAAYSGDSNYRPSTSSPIQQNVLKANTTTTLTSMPNPSNVGQTVQFTATVTGQYGGTPSGTVTFKDNGSVMAQVPLSQGVAQYQTSNLTEGKHHIAADYSGDSNFHPSKGQLIQVVQQGIAK
jgi:hypothetical protein